MALAHFRLYGYKPLINYSDLPAQEVNFSGLPACPGDVLSFTCVTRDSPILTWSSDQYIGVGGEQLEILSIDSPGTTFVSMVDPSTVAVLTNTTDHNGTSIIMSQLSIIVLPSIVQEYHSITCSNVGIGTETSITLQLAGKFIDLLTSSVSRILTNSKFVLSDHCYEFQSSMPSGMQVSTSVHETITTISGLQLSEDLLFISKGFVTTPHNGKLSMHHCINKFANIVIIILYDVYLPHRFAAAFIFYPHYNYLFDMSRGISWLFIMYYIMNISGAEAYIFLERTIVILYFQL